MTPLTSEDRADLVEMADELRNLLILMTDAEQRLPDIPERVYLRSSIEFVQDCNLNFIQEQLADHTFTAYQIFRSLSGLYRGLAEISSRTVGYDPAISALVSKVNQLAHRCALRASAQERDAAAR